MYRHWKCFDVFMKNKKTESFISYISDVLLIILERGLDKLKLLTFIIFLK